MKSCSREDVAVKAAFTHKLLSGKTVPWEFDPTSHAHLLDSYMEATLVECFPRPTSAQRHVYLTDHTMQLVRARGGVLRDVNKSGGQCKLACRDVIFAAWKLCVSNEYPNANGSLHHSCQVRGWLSKEQCMARADMTTQLELASAAVKHASAGDYAAFVASKA